MAGTDTTSSMSCPHVAVVGAGLAGLSCAYYLRKQLPAATITLLEAQGRIGGRVYDVPFWGQTVNVGASMFNAEQRNIAALVKELNLKTVCFKSSGAYPPNYVWDGHKFTEMSSFMANRPQANAYLLHCLKKFLSTMEDTYEKYDRGTFTSVVEFLSASGLEDYSAASVGTFFQNSPVDQAVQKYAIETVMEEFFGQGLEASAVLAMVCVAGIYQDAYRTEGGMTALVEALVNASSCNLHLNARVARVQRTGSGRFEVWYSRTGEEAELKLTSDVVVIAAPFEWAGVAFEGFSPSIMQPSREWEQKFFFVAHVAAKSLRQSYFKPDETTNWPSDLVLLSTTSSVRLPWTCIRVKGTSRGCHVYCVFSLVDVTQDGLLGSLFEGVQDHVVHRFEYLHALSPPAGGRGKFQDIKMADGVYYLNGLESVASQMEIAVISGRNVAGLIGQEFSC